ncbi:MAG: xanthine dehydrogenase family protein molybdopterin-binding subunit, partial [Janthinobacterium lividum]
MKFGIGQSPKRVEDFRLLTGKGRFTDDIQLAGALFSATVRSPYGHARIAAIDTSAAKAVPGVVAVYTHADIANYGVIPCLVPFSGEVATPHAMLTGDKARFVGDGIVFVVAETREAAREGADAVMIDYDELPAVTTIAEAIAPGAIKVWDDAPSNDLFAFPLGDGDKASAAIAAAAHVTRLRVVQNRVAPTSMEVRAAVGDYSEADGFTLDFGGQGVASARPMVAGIMGVEPDRVRIRTGDVGGGFGMKA